MMHARYTGVIALCLLAAGCGQERSDLADFVAQAKARPAAPIEPIPEIAPYTPYTYRADDRRTPFTPTTPQRDVTSNSDIAPDSNREREPLEAFPLDALRMVGTISRAGVTFGLIQAPDNVIHRVRPGDHIGRNYGKIDGISEGGVVLTEIVPDGLGGYIRRPATIASTR